MKMRIEHRNCITKYFRQLRSWFIIVRPLQLPKLLIKDKGGNKERKLKTPKKFKKVSSLFIM